MIDINSETLVPIKKAATVIPGRPHIATVYRWINQRSNPLETILVGGRRYTSREAVERFIERASSGVRDETPSQFSKRRQSEIEAAERELEEAGI